MLSRKQKRKGRRDIHFLNNNGMVVCNPKDKEAAHRTDMEGIATENVREVTCKKCLKLIRNKGFLKVDREKLL
jgi:hypothetical protein